MEKWKFVSCVVTHELFGIGTMYCKFFVGYIIIHVTVTHRTTLDVPDMKFVNSMHFPVTMMSLNLLTYTYKVQWECFCYDSEKWPTSPLPPSVVGGLSYLLVE